jgi:cation diffusion facilitator family transporter
MYKKLTKEQSGRLEERTLTVSLYVMLFLAVASLGVGLWLRSDVIILDGVFSLVSLLGSGLYLLAAKLVARPADCQFQYGYAHIEPLVNSVNALMLLVICVYGFFNGIEGIRTGGNAVDPRNIILYNIANSAVAGCAWAYEATMARRVDSQLLRNDAREWMISLAFSAATTLGFALVYVLPEPWRGTWLQYADSAMVAVMSLLFLPVPVKILNHNLREVLMMTGTDEVLVGRVEDEMRRIKAEYDIASHSSHIVKIGRIHFIELNLLVGPAFQLQRIEQQDQLRARIWAAAGRPIDEAWLSICLTADPRWT